MYVINFLLKLITLSANPDVLKETRKLLDDFLLHFVISLTNEVCVCVCVCECVYELHVYIFVVVIVHSSIQLQRISAEKPRYYINSATHRAKLRLMQCLIVASARIDEVHVEYVCMYTIIMYSYLNLCACATFSICYQPFTL